MKNNKATTYNDNSLFETIRKKKAIVKLSNKIEHNIRIEFQRQQIN